MGTGKPTQKKIQISGAEVDVIKMDLLLKRLDEMVEDSESH